MLLKIRDFLKQHKVASNQQIARAFKIDTVTLEPMLNVWLAKGTIARCEEKACGSSCAKKCKAQAPTYYRYLTA